MLSEIVPIPELELRQVRDRKHRCAGTQLHTHTHPTSKKGKSQGGNKLPESGQLSRSLSLTIDNLNPKHEGQEQERTGGNDSGIRQGTNRNTEASVAETQLPASA